MKLEGRWIMDNETLGIVIPVYNADKYLDECICSIISQTWKNWYLVLIDDGSTDKSGDICDYYANNDSRIEVIHQPNKGLVTARYNGVKFLNTDYVTFVDADDWIDADAYEVMMHYVVKYNPDIVFAGIKRFYTEERIVTPKSMIDEGFYDNEKLEIEIKPKMFWSRKNYGFYLDPSLCTKLFCRKKLLIQFENFRDHSIYYAEDSCIFYPYLLSAKSLYCTHKAFYYHRQKMTVTNNVPVYIKDKNFFDKLYIAYDYLRGIFINSKKEYAEDLIKQLEMFYIRSVRYKERCYGDIYTEKYQKGCVFPFAKIPQNSKIVLYGAGNVGQVYYHQINVTRFCHIVIWVDKYNHDRAKDIRALHGCEFDYIVVGIEEEYVCREVAEELHGIYDVPINQIIW